MIALLLLLQAPAPTVGDTIWLVRRVPVPPGAEVRPAAWELDGAQGLLGRPQVRLDGGDALVAYPAVAWAAGTQRFTVPGPIIVHADGRSDTLAAEVRTVVVGSVLPAGMPPERLAPQPEAGVVAQRITTPLPLLALVLLAALLLAPLVWWWLRRGLPAQHPTRSQAPADVPLTEWAEAGEHRAVAALAARRLRDALSARLPGMVPGLVTSRLVRVLEEQRPRWPAGEIGTLLRALESAEFAERPGSDVTALAARAGELVQALEREP